MSLYRPVREDARKWSDKIEIIENDKGRLFGGLTNCSIGNITVNHAVSVQRNTEKELDQVTTSVDLDLHFKIGLQTTQVDCVPRYFCAPIFFYSQDALLDLQEILWVVTHSALQY